MTDKTDPSEEPILPESITKTHEAVGEPIKPTEQELRVLWREEADSQTLESLPGFLKKLSEYPHDYGTICVALGAGALGTCRAMDQAPSGGITGFQAGAVFWEFYRGWISCDDGPAKLVKYNDLLYPQYESEFEKTISEDTWKWLKEKAQENLENNNHAHPDVVAHWQSIVDGVIPFGFRVKS